MEVCADNTRIFRFYVYCDGCGAQTGYRVTSERAIEEWNRRAASPAVPSSVEALRVTDEMVIQVGDVLMRHGLNAPEQAIYQAARAALEAALSRPVAQAGAVTVKALEWEDRPTLSTAQTNLVACYSVWESDGRWACSLLDGTLPSREAAKAAAQADYEQRIRSALVSHPPQAGAESELVERLDAYRHYLPAGLLEEEWEHPEICSEAAATIAQLQQRLAEAERERDEVLATSAAYNATEREAVAIMAEAASIERAEAAEAKLAEAVEVVDEILTANEDFRLGMPDGWEGDPLQDACDRARSFRASMEKTAQPQESQP